MFHLPLSSGCFHLPSSCVGKMPATCLTCSPAAGSGTPGGHLAASAGTKACSYTRITTFTILSVICVLIYLVIQPQLEQLQRSLDSVDSFTSSVIFLILFTVMSFPLTWGYIVVNVAAGYRFGLWVGYVLTAICVACGSLIAFTTCRFLCGHWLTTKLQTDHLKSIMMVVEGAEGFRVIALTRFTPIPFGLQNGLFAMSKVPASTFISASTVGLLPTQALNCYLGATLRSANDLSYQQSYSNAFLVFQLVISVCLTMYIVRVAQQRLQSKLETDTSSRHDKPDQSQLVSMLEPIRKVPLIDAVTNGGIPVMPAIIREANEVKIHVPS